MTAQVGEIVRVDERNYYLAGVDGAGLFNPRHEGLEPRMVSTACYRGYVCLYQVANNQLLLQELTVHLDYPLMLKAKYKGEPELFGKPPIYREDEEELFYGDLAKHISFSGNLLLGKRFISALYVHAGFHPAYKFESVLHLNFKDGQLISAADISQEMETFRQSLSHFERGIMGLISDQDDKFDEWLLSTFGLVVGPFSNIA